VTTLQTVQELLIERFGFERHEVDAEAKLHELGIDSLARIEFMFVLEEKFNLLPTEPTVAVSTVGGIAEQVDALIARQRVTTAARSSAVQR